jgi:glycosidase
MRPHVGLTRKCIWIKLGFLGSTSKRARPNPPFDDKSFYNHCGYFSGSSSKVKGDVNGLEDLKTSSVAVRQALLDIYGEWYSSAKVDGFRIDTVGHIEPDFWDYFSPGMRSIVNADDSSRKFMQFGEVYDATHTSSDVYTQGNRIDTLLNFRFYHGVKNAIANDGATTNLSFDLETRVTNLRDTTIDAGGAEITAQDTINFIDSHDVRRFMASADDYQPRLYLALMYLMTCKGIPVIYYNTENQATQTGTTGEEGRIDMPGFGTTRKMAYTLIRKLAQIRTDNISLRRGDISVLKDSTTAGIFAFARMTGDDTENIICTMNNSDTTITETIDVSAYQATGLVLENILSGAFGVTDEVTVADGNIEVTIEPYSMNVYKRKQ